MAEGKGKKDDFLWWVQCEGHYDVPVIAPNWELATVEAAGTVLLETWARYVSQPDEVTRYSYARLRCRNAS